MQAFEHPCFDLSLTIPLAVKDQSLAERQYVSAGSERGGESDPPMLTVVGSEEGT